MGLGLGLGVGVGAEKMAASSSSSSTEHKNNQREEFSVGRGGEDMTEMMMFAKRGRGCCAFWLPACCLDNQRSSSSSESTVVGLSVWERIRSAEGEDKWWMKGWKAVKKVREWSEIMAGPKWKTFIRRFNNNKNCVGGGGDGGRGGGGGGGKYQYDPLSYALNFDDGGTGGGDNNSLLDDDDDDDFVYRDFSSRYAAGAAIPIAAKNSMDLSKEDGPNFI